MARFGDALVEDEDLEYAAEHALAAALAPLDGRSPDLTAVFVCGDSVDATERALRQVASASGSASVVGCTASGVIGAAGSRAPARWLSGVPSFRTSGCARSPSR